MCSKTGIDRCFVPHKTANLAPFNGENHPRDVRNRCTLTPALVVILRFRGELANQRCRCKVLLVMDSRVYCTGKWRQKLPVDRFLTKALHGEGDEK